jgi:transposase
MTMTLADAARLDDGVVTPRADQPKRRMFTAEYKARILDEYDTADRGPDRSRDSGVIGA